MGGGLSFHIPGLETPVEGTWITVDLSTDNETVSEAFYKMHEHVEASKDREPPTVEELVIKFE